MWKFESYLDMALCDRLASCGLCDQKQRRAIAYITHHNYTTAMEHVRAAEAVSRKLKQLNSDLALTYQLRKTTQVDSKCHYIRYSSI